MAAATASFSSTGSFLSHVFGGGQPKVPQTVVDVNGNPCPL